METYNLINDLINKTLSQLLSKQSEALKKDLIPKLQYYGLDVNEDNFLDFAPRLTRVQIGENRYEFYLDYVEGQPITEQKFLVWYSDKMDIKMEGNTVIATIG